jgi:cell division protein FtsI/penicillin-binding protein 2
MNAEENTVQYKIRTAVLNMDKDSATDADKAREALTACYEKGSVRGNTILLAMIEQGTINADEDMKTKLSLGAITPFRAVLTMLGDGTMTPEMTAMDPCTGSAVVTDVKTGGVIAAVTYPSYDNNEFVNTFNSKYYRQLQSSTLTPMVNRPFTEPRAPGSIFKMITATAGLEEGFISPSTTIYDEGTFKDAGEPYAKCWINSGNGSHGDVNVSKALEVSCNYFFYKLSFSFNNGKNDTNGISLLNKYMRSFGLNDPVGVEIYELYDSMTDYPSRISGPEYKEYVAKLRNPDAPSYDTKWTAGDTIRTAIGQSLNNYTSAQISKYIATLANGGTRYKMHLMNNISTADGETVEQYQPVEEEKLSIKQRNLNAIFNGMLLVTTGENGTLTKVFKDYPVKVPAKSGTAQESKKRSEHTTFVAFAPYDEPQVAISVMIPYGNDSTTTPAPNTAKEIISEYLKLNAQPETKQNNILMK